MHEWSLCHKILNQAAEIARQQGAVEVIEIRIQCGPLSGIEPLLLEHAFGKLVIEQGLAPIRLVIEETPLVARCQECGHESEIRHFDFRCQACQGRQVKIVQGDELQIVSITVESTSESDKPGQLSDSHVNAHADSTNSIH